MQYKSDEAIALLKTLLTPANLAKAAGWSQPANATTGIAGYNLEPRARMLVPVLTPLRNLIPRKGGGFGTAVNWRAITAINSTFIEPGTSEGNRNQYVSHTTKDFTAAYKTLSLDGFITEQAQWAGRTFEDILSLATEEALLDMMIAEENTILGGLSSYGLNAGVATPTPSLSGSSTGGALTHATYSVICVALAHNAYYANGKNVTGTAPVRGAISVTTVNGASVSYGGGAAKKSAAATVTIATAVTTGSITGTVTNVAGAMAYAWFWGPAGSEVLGAVTTINSVVIKAAAAGTQTAASLGTADNSANSLVFDGILAQVFASGSGAQIITQPTGTAGTGTPLTAVGDGSIAEFETILQNFWDTSRLAPDTVWMNSQERANIQKKIIQGNSASTQRFVFSTDQKTITGSSLATGYLNKFGMNGGPYAEGSMIEFRTHPTIAPGTLLFTSKTLPYTNSRIPNVLEMDIRQEYWQRQYPQTAPQYTFAVMCDEVLKCYAPFALGSITNIGNG